MDRGQWHPPYRQAGWLEWFEMWGWGQRQGCWKERSCALGQWHHQCRWPWWRRLYSKHCRWQCFFPVASGFTEEGDAFTILASLAAGAEDGSVEAVAHSRRTLALASARVRTLAFRQISAASPTISAMQNQKTYKEHRYQQRELWWEDIIGVTIDRLSA